MSRPCRIGMAAAILLALGWIAPWSARAADRPAVVVDLGALDALDTPAGPGWVPPIPGRRPAPPIRPASPVLAEPVEAPASISAPPRPQPVVQTAPVQWRRPIPVTAGAYHAQQVGALANPPTPPAGGKLGGAVDELAAPANLVLALPNGDGFRLLFVDDGTALSETGELLLDTLAARMDVRADLRLNVLAYAGGTPETASRSRLLSLERGLAVRNYLFEQGVRGSRIDVRALGNTFADGPAERVDLLLTD